VLQSEPGSRIPPPLARLSQPFYLPATRASRPGLHAATAGAAGLRDRTIRSSDPMDRAVSVGRVRQTRPTAESKAAARRRSGWARSARSQIAGYS